MQVLLIPERGRKNKAVYTSEIVCMFFKVICLLGQFVRQATSRNTWNTSLKEYFLFSNVIVEICLVLMKLYEHGECNSC